jgi:Protein of unknown function (DUF732)
MKILKTICPLFATAAALLPVAVAHADPQDGQFLASLSRDGLQITPDQAIPIAHETCNAQTFPRWVPRMPSPFAIATWHINDELQGLGIVGPRIGQFKRDASAAYCPGALDQ